MVVKCVLQQQKDDMSGNSENYYFAKAVSTGEVNFKTICEDIFGHSVLEAIAIALLFVLNFIYGFFAGVLVNRAKIRFQKNVQVYIRGIHIAIYSGFSILYRRSCRSERADLFNNPVQQAYKTKWVVHCKPSLASADNAIRYLGQYTHRVAITNQRILNIVDGKVTFIAKDYRDRAVKKPITLDGVEFLRQFTLHILPQRFVKIRRFGIYNHTVKRNLELQFVPSDIDKVIEQQKKPETTIERFQRLTGIDPCLCPVYKKGRMVAIRELPRICAPTWLMFNVTNAHS